MGSGQTVAVFGAYGHTGRFVVAELRERGFVPVSPAATPDKLQALAASHPGLDARPASVDDPASLDRALAGAAAVINCAGPVRHDRRPGDRGGAARRDPVRGRGGRDRGQRRHVRALRGPRPRRGRRGGPRDGLLRRPRRPAGHRGDGRLDGGRRGARRVRAEQLAPHRRDARRGHGLPASGATAAASATPAGGWSTTTTPCRPWSGPSPTRWAPGPSSASSRMADVVTVPSHLAIPEVRTYMTVEAARDLAAPDTPAPAAVDERGRSAQTFLVDVVVRSGGARTARRGAAARTSTPSARRSRWKRSTASSPAGPGRSASPPPARSSTRPTSCARCPRTSRSNCVGRGRGPASGPPYARPIVAIGTISPAMLHCSACSSPRLFTSTLHLDSSPRTLHLYLVC